MHHTDFRNWLHGVRVLLVECSEWSARASWMIEAGATVTRMCTPASIAEPTVQRDVVIVDLALPGAREMLGCLTPGCSVMLVAAEANGVVAELADQLRAAIVLQDTPRADFLFEVQRSARVQVPNIDYLVGRAGQLWKLPPQQARVLFYNLWSQSDREIARAIGISVHTVQEHQNGLRRRTGARSKYGYFRCLAEAAGMRPPLEDG